MEQKSAIRLIDLDDGREMLELLALQAVAYLKEAEMIGLTDIPPLLESPASVRESGQSYYGLFTEEGLAGAISLQKESGLLHICRLMVRPDRLRRGIASALLEFAVHLAEQAGESLRVMAVATNHAALILYGRFGFQTVDRHPAVNGLTLYEMVRPYVR